MIAVLLPRMDGTGTLFEPFVRELPPHVNAVRVSYPAGVHLSYDQMAGRSSARRSAVGMLHRAAPTGGRLPVAAPTLGSALAAHEPGHAARNRVRGASGDRPGSA